jgi:signal transduction histidine kinase
MALDTLWTAAEISCGVAAIAALTVAASIWRHAGGGREAGFLSGSLVALAAHYGCVAIDAWLHAAGGAVAPFTIWTALGHTGLTVSGALFFGFLLVVVGRLAAPDVPNRWLVWAVVVHAGTATAIALALAGRLVADQLVGRSAVAVAADIDEIVMGAGRVADAFLVTGPVAYCSLLLERVPRGGGPHWIRWLADGGPWRLVQVSHRAGSAFDARDVSPHTARFLALMLACLVLGVDGTATRGTEYAWTPASLSLTLAGQLLLLPILLGLVVIHARPVFFDVVLKRGALNLGIATLTSLVCGAVLVCSPVRLGAFLGPAWIALIVIACLTASAYEHASRLVDQVLFRRADYQRALQRLSWALAGCIHVDALRVAVTEALTSAFDGTRVQIREADGPPGDVTVGLGRPERPRGYLTLGPRPHGRPYSSEDLTFVAAVAAQFAARLEALEAAEARHLTTMAELRALRAQINPHFLFNALSTLAEMTRDQPAERAVLNLAEVFRYALESTQHERQPLRAELEAIRAYLEIEGERFEDRLQFDVEVPADLLETPIPPMLLQPLVENAVTHGLATLERPGRIRIVATHEPGYLHLLVEDDGIGFDPATSPRHVGLANVGARVEGTGGSWAVQSRPGGGTAVRLAVVTS